MLNFFLMKNDVPKGNQDVVEELHNDPQLSQEAKEFAKVDNGVCEQKFESKIDMILQIAPYFKALLGEEIGFYVADTTHMRYACHGHVNLRVKAGDKIAKRSISDRTIKAETRISARVNKELFGVPYIGTGHPIKDDNNKVIGTIVTVEPIELQESLHTSAKVLEDTVNTINAAINSLVTTAGDMVQTSTGLNNAAQNINNEIKKTDEVGIFITEVSERTHLLSLNAAIEAARAGEQGKGFTIVANEIRKMSGDTKGSVKEIKQNLKEMKNSIAELVSAFEQISAISEHQSASIQEISASVQSLLELAAQLKEDAEKLTS